MDERQVAFVGGGNMAAALLAGMLRSGWRKERVRVLEPAAQARERLQRAFDVACGADANWALGEAQVVVWAVKPQVFKEAAARLSPSCASALHITIAAGVRLEDACRWLGSQRVVRAMPNLPAQVGQGTTGVLAHPRVAPGDAALAEALLGTVGHCFRVSSDAQMDAVTAVSGSGPAYVFDFLDSLAHAACLVGFDAGQARQVALQVVQGAAAHAAQCEDTFEALRTQVTSPGGTTEAALQVLEQRGVRDALAQAVAAARARARELGAELGR